MAWKWWTHQGYCKWLQHQDEASQWGTKGEEEGLKGEILVAVDRWWMLECSLMRLGEIRENLVDMCVFFMATTECY